MRFLFPNRQSKNNSYTWKKEWIEQFESPWSILKKFQVTNCLSANELYSTFGTEKVRTMKGNIGNYLRSLYTLEGFDVQLIEDALQFSLIQENATFRKKILEPLVDNDMLSGEYLNLHYMSDYLTYCPLCITYTYHSLLHQFHFIQKCPTHSLLLQNSCPKCNQKIPYVLDDQFYKSPFVCKCGYKFAKIDRRINTFKSFNLKGSYEYKWLNINNIKPNHCINSNIFFESLREGNAYTEDDFKFELSDIFVFLYKQNHILTTKKNIAQTRSISQIRAKRANKLKRYYNFKRGDYQLKHLEIESKYLCNKLFNSIARHLRKTILKNHIGCIKHFTRCAEKETLTNKDVCPFAIAYTVWRTRLQRFNKVDYVDNYGMPPFGREYFNGYPIYRGYGLISNLLGQVESEDKAGRRALFHWKMNRFVGELILADFKRCVIAAKDFANNNGFDWGYINSFEHLSKVIIEPPVKPNNKYYLYLKISSSIYLISNELHCPKNSKK